MDNSDLKPHGSEDFRSNLGVLSRSMTFSIRGLFLMILVAADTIFCDATKTVCFRYSGEDADGSRLVTSVDDPCSIAYL